MDQEPALSANLVVLERNRVLDAALLAAIPIGVIGFVAAALFRMPMASISIDLSIVSLLVRWALARQNQWAKKSERAVTFSKSGVVVDGKLVPAASISDGWYQPKDKGRATIQLFDRRKRMLFEAEVAHEAEAVEMLRALGLDASRRRAEFRVMSAISQHQWTGLAMIVSAVLLVGALRLTGSHELARMGVPFVLLACLLVSLWPMKIVVGRDAITTAWLGVRRTYPMANLREVQADGETRIALVMNDWKTEILHTSSAKRHGGAYTHHRDAILARIREALASHKELEAGTDLSTVVGRAGRSTEEWKTALAALENTEAGYRNTAVRTEDLWRVVEDPRASADARVGAALVLRRGLDDEGKARVRVAAEASASPKLRIALEAATNESDDEALAALEAIPLRSAASEGR